tara:strand:+ start:743 stop:946 length:204 start_codon:yes stop_codon:yes gene_type:complete
MNYILKRFGLIVYGFLSVVESLLNLVLYVTNLDKLISSFDVSLPFYFWYTNKFLKGTYITNLKDKHG